MNIHPKACVESGAELGENVEVGPCAYVGPDAVIGDNCIMDHGAHVEGHTILGSNNHLYPHAVLGTPPQDKKYHGEDTRLEIGDDNVFREHCTVNIGTPGGEGITTIGDRNFLMIGSHVGHDCTLDDEVILVNGVLLGGHCRVESGAKLMGGAAANPFVTIGKLSFVGGLSRIIRDVPPYMIMEGNPAKVRRVNEVGLERAGYDEETIQSLDDAYRQLFRTKRLNGTKVFEEIENQSDVAEEVMYLVEFMRRSLEGRHGRYRESLR
ncbi:MAG: acyl-ACP--UDP-N-acetylglucosamine O-acyltransferase [Planctomycetota bacterium]